jgi:hypothetical protein
MNKELIKKYKTEFDYWLNGGELLAKYPETHGEFVPAIGVKWKDDTAIYIINDEYVEFRKALAEGKIIQWNSNYNKSYEHWIDVCDQTGKMFNLYTADIMRIKPEEPTFKVGDWVTVNDGRPHQFKRFTKDLPEWNKSLDYENVEMLSGTKFHIPKFDRSIVKLWSPKPNEWCVFKDIDESHYIVDQFEETEGDKHWAKSIETWFQEIYPLEFINTLKD